MDKSWKALERRIAKLFGCKRRGADFRGPNGGKDDLTHEKYAVEVKLLARPTFGQMLDACRQAESSAAERQPLAIVKRKRDRDIDALVSMRLETWLQWHPQAEPPTKGCETREPEPTCLTCYGTGWHETANFKMTCACLGWRGIA